MKLLVKKLEVEGYKPFNPTDLNIVEFNRLDERIDTFRLDGALINNLKIIPYNEEVPGVIYEGDSLYIKKISGNCDTGDTDNIYQIYKC